MNVYDFDNTIYRGESGADLFFFYLKRDPKLLRKVPWGLKLLAQYKSGRMTLQQVLETYSDEVVGYWQTIGDFDGDLAGAAVAGQVVVLQIAGHPDVAEIGAVAHLVGAIDRQRRILILIVALAP